MKEKPFSWKFKVRCHTPGDSRAKPIAFATSHMISRLYVMGMSLEL
jgi:hypothetical protein